jgi:uncharacterized protein YndB with AHSA1/START domain
MSGKWRRPATIEKQIEVNAPLDAVWKALTDSAELARWFPLEAKVKPGVRGALTLSWGPECEGTARISVWEPEKNFQWQEPAPLGSAAE